jgi:hypothetical protein
MTWYDKKDIIERGMLSIMQMHSNATGTAETKSWKNTYHDISTLYHEELNSNKLTDSVINETQQEPPNETSDSDDDDDDDDSDYVDTNIHKKTNLFFQDEEDSDDPEMQNTLGNKSFSDPDKHRKKALFDDESESDEEESDDPGTQNTLGKESGHEKIVGIDSQHAVTESGKVATNDVSDKSDQEPETTNKSDAAGNNKKAADENLQVNKENTKQIWSNDEEDDYDPEIYSGKKIYRRQ